MCKNILTAYSIIKYNIDIMQTHDFHDINRYSRQQKYHRPALEYYAIVLTIMSMFVLGIINTTAVFTANVNDCQMKGVTMRVLKQFRNLMSDVKQDP